MQIITNTIVTHVDELTELIRHCRLNGYDGQINLNINEGNIYVWIPNITEKSDIIDRFPTDDEQIN